MLLKSIFSRLLVAWKATKVEALLVFLAFWMWLYMVFKKKRLKKKESALQCDRHKLVKGSKSCASALKGCWEYWEHFRLPALKNFISGFQSEKGTSDKRAEPKLKPTRAIMCSLAVSAGDNADHLLLNRETLLTEFAPKAVYFSMFALWYFIMRFMYSQISCWRVAAEWRSAVLGLA